MKRQQHGLITRWTGPRPVDVDPEPRQLAPCGTPTAAERHRNRGEKPCEPCRLAYNAARREKHKSGRGAA